MAKNEYTNIEFVDLLNTGSLVAEATARKYLSEKDLGKNVNINSSGVIITLEPGKFRTSMRFLEDYFNLAIQNKLCGRSHIDSIRKSKSIADLGFFLKGLRQAEEVRLLKILKRKNLINHLPEGVIGNPKQTTVQNYSIQTGLIFAMSNEACTRAKQIYSRFETQRPGIIKLKYFLKPHQETQELPFVVENYDAAVTQIQETTKKAIEKLIKQ